ncbi:MAG: nitronate monooxygenase [Pseudomonadales bacterium]
MADFPGNRFTNDFELDVPIVQGPMGGAAGSELVAAVCNAGGLGILPIWFLTPVQAALAVRETRQLTARSFGVNLRADLVQTDHITAAVDEGVSIIHLFWGDPSASMEPIRAAGARMICTVGDAGAARRALAAGASALIAQGVEAGGHVLGEVPLRDLLGSVVPIAGTVPVVAAGGLANAEDVAEVMSLGASGALLGTRFVATRESISHDDYKQALIKAGADSTARSECFEIGWPNAPHRHLSNETYTSWERAGRPAAGARPGEGDILLRAGDIEVPRYSVMPPERGMVGNVRGAVLYAGTGVARIGDCPDAATVVRELASLL